MHRLYYLFLLFLISYHQNGVKAQLPVQQGLLPDSLLVFPAFLDLAGDSAKISDFKGKVLLLDFWFMGCKPCVHAMPNLQKLQDDFDTSRFVVLGLNPMDKDVDKITAFLHRHEISYSIGLIEFITAYKHKISVFPTVVLLDKQGHIKYIEEGNLPGMKMRLKRKIRRLLK